MGNIRIYRTLSEALDARYQTDELKKLAALICSEAYGKKIRVSAKTGRAAAATVKTIGELLCEGDWYDDDQIGPMQAFAWPLLLQGGGLAKTDGSSLVLTPAGLKAQKKDLVSIPGKEKLLAAAFAALGFSIAVSPG